jgi:hypothetical protein
MFPDLGSAPDITGNDGEFMEILELLREKRAHLERSANQAGAAGEYEVLAKHSDFISRPKGVHLTRLLEALKETGIDIKKSSFDAIAVPSGITVNFESQASLQATVSLMTFIEIKTASQNRVRPDFGGFFFAITESEIAAAYALGNRHRVMLFNKSDDSMLLTSIPELLRRVRSMTWQLSIQL